MRLYQNKWAQICIALLYAITVYNILGNRNGMNPWYVVLTLACYCALWGNVRYLLLSTAIMGATAVPLWWFTIAPYQTGYMDILGWYPLIIINFLLFILLPEMIIVSARNAVLQRVRHTSD